MSRLRMLVFATNRKRHERGDFVSSRKVNKLFHKQLEYSLMIDAQMNSDFQISKTVASKDFVCINNHSQRLRKINSKVKKT